MVRGVISDLVLKTIYLQGEMVAQDVADTVALPFVAIVRDILATLKRETYVGISGGGTHGEQSMRYTLTERGSQRAREMMLRSQYVGPAPVPLEDYWEVVGRQSVADVQVTAEDLEEAFDGLVLPQNSIDLLGPAINSGRSIFIYGAPGTGKTTVAEAIPNMLGSIVFIPHALIIEGQVIKVYDEEYHEYVSPREWQDAVTETEGGRPERHDMRWVPCKRPVVIVGGELTLEELNLVYDPIAKFHEAPPQVKANGGMMLIDDFGRQQVRPVDLLNRWMVPLERRVDFLRLHTGKKIDVPFDELIVFSTNLEPAELVDEAFLRRIRHKIELKAPTEEQFRQIMQGVCESRGVTFDEGAFGHLLVEWYEDGHREFRSVHPRDIIDQIIDIARYEGSEPAMTESAIDRACRSYFVEI